jgi:DNA-binding PadR family transcriptional regulator
MSTRVKRKSGASSLKEEPASGIRLTTPDLVILSLLAERPMHGYEVNATLEERKIRRWAAVSRPQIYYSLDKLQRLRLLRVTAEDDAAAGPERRVLETTERGKERLADALESSRWVTNQAVQPFLTWLALSWKARPRTFKRQLSSRLKFLRERLAETQAILKSVLAEVGHPFHEAVWMLELVIAQMEIEIRWAERILEQAPQRAPAMHPKAVR